MRKHADFFRTSFIVIMMTALGWRYGYSAATHGERSDVGGAIFVAVGFIVIFGTLWGLKTAWRMATMSGPGVSPLRYVLLAAGMIGVGLMLLGTLSPFALAGDSFSLGIVITVLLGVIYCLARRSGLIDPREPVNLMRPPDNEYAM